MVLFDMCQSSPTKYKQTAPPVVNNQDMILKQALLHNYLCLNVSDSQAFVFTVKDTDMTQ